MPNLWLATPLMAQEQPIPHTGVSQTSTATLTPTHTQAMARDTTYGSRATHPPQGGQDGRCMTSAATPTPMKLKH